MLSVLIPVYNYKVRPLINELLIQFKNISCEWEILLSDDASSKEIQIYNSSFIKGLNNSKVILFQQKVNYGNGANRNFLIDQASFEWLLFLDADVLPVKTIFLLKYFEVMQFNPSAIIAGNIVYDTNNPQPHLLRWKYGLIKEQVDLETRKKKPILNIRGANFAIKRELAKSFNFPILKEKYGFVDTRFFLQFTKEQLLVIENPVFHLGIENNDVFLKKTKQAISNALFLMDNKDEMALQISIVSSYKKVRKFKWFFAKLYTMLSFYFEKKLHSNKPSVFIFQIYKLLYISYLDFGKNIK